jgi:hypothetical protein
VRVALDKIPGADPACKDAARFFFPSKQIMRVERDQSCANWLVAQSIDSVPLDNQSEGGGKIPGWILNFVNNGVLVEKGSRNCTVFRILIWFEQTGFDLDWAVALITRAPINWHGVNLSATVKNLKNKTARN